MTVDVGMEFSGLKDALAELNKIDKSLRRQITKDFKQIVQPVVDRAQSQLPSGAPLSGMAYKWTGKSGADIMSWQDSRMKRNIKAFTSSKKVRETASGAKQNLGIFGVKWAGPQAAIFDMLSTGQLGESLTAKYGGPSRIIYKAYESASNEVDRQIKELVNRVMKLTGNQGRI
jgi:hypothetical protein